ncbi:MAG: choice-of-anchor D domain-containing protein, partial [Bradymonadaceae bacterium]
MKFHPAILVLIIALGLMGCPKTDDTTPPITVTDDAGQDITADADEEDAEPVLDAEIHLPGPGQIIVSPTSLTYKDVRLGDSVDETITIRNTGTGPLTIEDLSLAQSTVRNGLEIKRGDQWLEGFTVIEPNTFRDITVRYEPNDYVTDRGSLKILSDDPDEPMVEVRIETINAYPDMEAPTSLRFGTVAVGDHILEPFVIYNRGGDPLNISAITYEGSDSFVVEYPGADPIPAHLARNEHLIVHIRYTPENDDVDHGKIILSTNDPDDEEFEILLTGNGPTPCISVSGDVDFGEPEVGERVTEQVTLLNCS